MLIAQLIIHHDHGLSWSCRLGGGNENGGKKIQRTGRRPVVTATARRRVVIAILWFSYHYHYHGYHLTLTITDDTPPPYHSVPKQYLDAN